MKLSILKYIENKFPKEKFLKNLNKKKLSWFYENQKADAINGYQSIKKFLKKDMKILEVGGGMHFLSNYLAYLNYNITSIEPGGFRKEIDIIRYKILKMKEKKLIIENDNLEKFSENRSNEFDFIFSINVLEHTKNIYHHLKSQDKLLKNRRSIGHIRCPNYTFPFESHFYQFFVPFLPRQTFKYFYEKALIKKYGKLHYYSIINSLNFNCTYFKIKKHKFNLNFHSPLKEIFIRIEKDEKFKDRILSNSVIRYIYFLLRFFKIDNFISVTFPIFLTPYLIMNQKKNNFDIKFKK